MSYKVKAGAELYKVGGVACGVLGELTQQQLELLYIAGNNYVFKIETDAKPTKPKASKTTEDAELLHDTDEQGAE